MNRKHGLVPYLFIGIGIYFFLQQLPFFMNSIYFGWQLFLMVIGLIVLIHAYQHNIKENLFIGTIVLGIGLHQFGLLYFSFWLDHWAMYFLLFGIAAAVWSQRARKGMVFSLLIILIAIILLFSEQLAAYFPWIREVVLLFEAFWSIVLIIIGVVLLVKK